MTTQKNGLTLALMAEVVAVLAQHQELRVVPEIVMDAQDDGLLTISLTVHPTSADEGLEVLSLFDELRYVSDVATVRGVVSRYGLEAAPLEAILRREDAAPDISTVLTLSDEEREVLESVITSGCALGGWIHRVDRPLLLDIRERLLTPEQKAVRGSQ